jgi:hypothetical protein
MPLTRKFKETVQARLQSDRKYPCWLRERDLPVPVVARVFSRSSQAVERFL